MKARLAQAARVVIVDDEPIMAMPYVEALVSDGFDVSVANTAEEFHKVSSTKAPDVVIVDMMMPGPKRPNDPQGMLGGASLLQDLVDLPRFSMTKFMVLTRLSDHDVEDALASLPAESRARVAVHHKIGTPPWFLPELVRSALARNLAS